MISTKTSSRRPSSSGGSSSTGFPTSGFLSKGRPSLTVNTARSRSRIRTASSSDASTRTRSLSPPPSSIVSAAPTLVPSGFGSIPDNSMSRLSLTMAKAELALDDEKLGSNMLTSGLHDDTLSDEDLPRSSISSGYSVPQSLLYPNGLPPSFSRIMQNGNSTVRTRETKSSLGFHGDLARPTKPSAMKHYQFMKKDDHRLHAHTREKAPWPLSYDRNVLELESLNNRLIRHLCKGSVSFVEYNAGPEPSDPIGSDQALPSPPERCLDLGCGLGTWIIEAAKEWPNCEFVGFDLVNIQLPLDYLEDSVAGRIEWLHGNFLTTRLPFEDDEFDHIHIQSIAKGVPENKWPYLFEEVNRVLRPGGAIEMIDEDVIFPLSPGFWSALRPKSQNMAFGCDLRLGSLSDVATGTSPPYNSHSPSNSISRLSTSSTAVNEEPSHDHALLECLYMAIFEQRFINMKPTSMLPSYFTTYFRHVNMGPVLNFSMPPLPPPKPRAPTSTATMTIIDTLGLSSPTTPSESFLEKTESPGGASLSAITRSHSQGESITSSMDVQDPVGSSVPLAGERERSSSDASMRSIAQVISQSPVDVPPVPPLPGVSPHLQPMKISEIPSPIQEDSAGIPPHFKPFTLEADDLSVKSITMFDTAILASIHPRSLCMHLYYSYSNVLACSEAMLELLKDWQINRKSELRERFGWDVQEEDDGHHRKTRAKFQELIGRFEEDMRRRSAFWAEQCEDFGWEYPPQDVLTKAEEIEDARFREAMAKLRKELFIADAPLDGACRSIRVLVGYKDSR